MTTRARDDTRRLDTAAGGAAPNPSHPSHDRTSPVHIGAMMDQNRLTQALLDRAPRLGAPVQRLGDDGHRHYLDKLAMAVASAWARNTASTSSDAVAGDAAAVRAVVDAAWRCGYQAGARAGHAVVADYIDASARDVAEPARADMSDRHRDVANRLHAARVPTAALRRYLIESGARHAGTWRGGDIFRLPYPVGIAEVLVPRPGVRDHPHRIFDAAALIADAEDRSVASVLADLATPPNRPPLSHTALRYPWQVYDTASEVGSRPARLKDPGPAHHDYAAANADGAWSASAVILSQLRGDSCDSADTIRIGNRTSTGWLRAVDSDARCAADTARASQHLNHNPATSAFRALPSIDPTLSATAVADSPSRPPRSRAR
jgi:hypothetical protein